jgi:rRNA-processing protein EBP2
MRDLAALRRKVEEISYHPPEGMKRVPWIETLVVSGTLEHAKMESKDDTVKLEKAMHDAALESVKEGYRRLSALNVPASRPADFLAEMLRADSTMAKVKERLTEEAAKIKAVETRKRVQAEKKFAKKGPKANPKKTIKKSAEATDEYRPLPTKGDHNMRKKNGNQKNGMKDKRPRKDLFKHSNKGKKFQKRR